MPIAGEKTGAFAVGSTMVNVPVATSLLVRPKATARASTVVVADNVIAPVYLVDEAVGVVPFVV
jgi:hypothetical protein